MMHAIASKFGRVEEPLDGRLCRIEPGHRSGIPATHAVERCPDSRAGHDQELTATVGSRALIGQLWPLMAATAVANMAVTAPNLFIAPIAMDLATSTALVGGLRALSGVAALGVGFTLAPLIDRVPRGATLTIGLLAMVAANLVLTVGSLPSLALFYLLVGATTAVLLPTIQAASADRFHGPASGQAVAVMVSIPSFMGMLTGPLLVLPALVAGWQGAFTTIAAGCFLVALLVAPTQRWQRPEHVERLGYRAAFTRVAQAPGAVALLTLSTLRNCLWFGWLTYLAAYFTEGFDGSVGLVAWVWLVGSASFFIAGVVTARLANPGDDTNHHQRRSPLLVLLVCVPANLLLGPLVFISPGVLAGLLVTTAFCVTNGAAQAAMGSLLIRRYASLRGAVMGLNTAGTNVGTIAGAMVAGLGLSLGGYAGLALTLVLLGGAVVVALVAVFRALDAQQPATPSADEGKQLSLA